jgi:sortase A
MVQKAHVESRLSFYADVNNAYSNTGVVFLPKSLEISSIGVGLPIEQTAVIDNIWQISDDGISHLKNSSYPGRDGNIILYAHNTSDRLGRLYELKNGDRIEIQTKEKTFTYEVYEEKVVTPDNIEYLTSHDGETLTIYTCTGFADTKRLVVKAKRVN